MEAYFINILRELKKFFKIYISLFKNFYDLSYIFKYYVGVLPIGDALLT